MVEVPTSAFVVVFINLTTCEAPTFTPLAAASEDICVTVLNVCEKPSWLDGWRRHHVCHHNAGH